MAQFWKLLTPDQVISSVHELDVKELKANGITAIITDLDNTLVPWRHYELAPGVIELLAKLKVEGMKICIASNTLHTERLKKLAETMDIPFVDRVRKPRRGGFLRAMHAMGSRRDNTAVFGDQIFTDVLAGNRLDLMTILLRPPLSKEEFFSTQMVRTIENVVIKRLRERDQWPAAERISEALEAMPDPRDPITKRNTNIFLWLLLAASTSLAAWIWKKKRSG